MMKISSLITQLQPKISAKGIIKGLILVTIPLWLGCYLYLLSNKTSGLLFDYGIELSGKEEILKEEAKKKAILYSPDLVPIYRGLCQISLCQNKFSSAENYINALMNCTSHLNDITEQANLYLFAANIHRDFKSFEQAHIKYEGALLLIDSATQKSNLKDWDYLKRAKARTLNNLGTTYLLQGKIESNRSQRWKDYSLAKEYLAKAAQIVDARDHCLYKTIQTNLQQCLTEMNFLD